MSDALAALPARLRDSALLRHWPALATLAAVFAVSRAAAAAAGVHFDTSPLFGYWQFVDPQLLRHDLAQSIWYLHSQPPLFNLLVGLGLKAFGSSAGAWFHAAFLALGLTETVLLYVLLAGLGVRRGAATALSGLFSVLPATILYENLLFYDYLVLVLLTGTAVAVLRYLSRPSFAAGSLLFGLAACVVLTRSLFQVIWLLALAVLLLCCSPRKMVLASLVVPLAVVLVVYGKNAAIAGQPTTSTWLGMSLSRLTVFQLPPAERQALVAGGTLHRVSLVGPFNPLSAYAGDYAVPKRQGVPVLDRALNSNGTTNFNDLAYVDISRRFLDDDLWVIEHRPQLYAKAVALGVSYFFRSPTDKAAGVTANRDRIGWWNTIVDRALYARIDRLRRVGVLLLAAYAVALLWGLDLAIRAVRRRRVSAREGVLLFAWLTVLYVVAVGSGAELFENFRFRFVVDPLALSLLAVAVPDLVGRVRGRRTRTVGS